MDGLLWVGSAPELQAMCLCRVNLLMCQAVLSVDVVSVPCVRESVSSGSCGLVCFCCWSLVAGPGLCWLLCVLGASQYSYK